MFLKYFIRIDFKVLLVLYIVEISYLKLNCRKLSQVVNFVGFNFILNLIVILHIQITLEIAILFAILKVLNEISQAFHLLQANRTKQIVTHV